MWHEVRHLTSGRDEVHPSPGIGEDGARRHPYPPCGSAWRRFSVLSFWWFGEKKSWRATWPRQSLSSSRWRRKFSATAPGQCLCSSLRWTKVLPQFPLQLAVQLARVFDQELDSARQLHAHRWHLDELGVTEHFLCPFSSQKPQVRCLVPSRRP